MMVHACSTGTAQGGRPSARDRVPPTTSEEDSPILNKTIIALLCLLGACGQAALADSCKDNFKDSGDDPRNGITYVTWVTEPGLDAHSALGQVTRRAIDQGYSVGLPVFAGVSYRPTQNSAASQMLMMQQAKPPLPLAVSFDAGSQRLSVGVSLAPGQQAPRDGVRDALCKLIDGLDAGAEGKATAEAAFQQSGLNTVHPMKAEELSQSLSKELAAARPGEHIRFVTKDPTHQQLADQQKISQVMMPKMVVYLGRTYDIDGQIGYIDNATRPMYLPGKASDYSFEFLVWKMKGLGGIGGADEMPFNRFQVVCHLADKDKPRFQTMKQHDFAHMRGVVTELTPSSIVLSQCTQVNGQ